jgi:hypothetical protein
MRYKRAVLTGMCVAAVLRGFRNGFSDFKTACIAASEAAKNAPTGLEQSIPAKSLSALLGKRRIDVQWTKQPHVDGQLPVEEARAVLSLLVLTQPKIVLEIGTFYGYTTKAMAENLPEATIHTVDLPPDFDPSTEEDTQKDDFHLINQRKVGEAFQNTVWASRIVQHFGDTAAWDFNEAAGASFFFIDGSHTYAYCKNDSEKCFALCKGQGIFVWHDCDEAHLGVLRLIAEWRDLGRDIVRLENTPLCYWNSL